MTYTRRFKKYLKSAGMFVAKSWRVRQVLVWRRKKQRKHITRYGE